jgi:hypothetical protein
MKKHILLKIVMSFTLSFGTLILPMSSSRSSEIQKRQIGTNTYYTKVSKSLGGKQFTETAVLIKRKDKIEYDYISDKSYHIKIDQKKLQEIYEAFEKTFNLQEMRKPTHA